MKTSNNTKTYAFTGGAALITAALIAMVLLFTGCPNSAGGGGSSGGGGGTPPGYTSVPYANLDNYLKSLPNGSTVHKIEVTGLTAAVLKGPGTGSTPSSPLGEILKANSTKKVTLMFGGVSGLTDMSACFLDCTSLIHAPEIPASVTNMSHCFKGCTSLTQAPQNLTSVTNMYSCFNGCISLTQAPQIPSSVTFMRSCFEGCTSLTSVTLKCNYVSGNSFKDAFTNCGVLPTGGIKVPTGYLQTYKDNASTMGTQADRFTAE